jgi:hypothetical protein
MDGCDSRVCMSIIASAYIVMCPGFCIKYVAPCMCGYMCVLPDLRETMRVGDFTHYKYAYMHMYMHRNI